MNYTFDRPKLSGRIRAISSKSEAHRQLICAALADGETEIVCSDTNLDIDATAGCLRSLGADIEREDGSFCVRPIYAVKGQALLDCGESGSTLRFIIPVAAALGADCKIKMHGRLPSRPLSPLYELLCENGAVLSPVGENPFYVGGKLKCGDFFIRADVSSQFISGLLFALPLLEGKSSLTLTGKAESLHYIDMTLDALRLFGAGISKKGDTFYINPIKKFKSPGRTCVGGDWSNAAFFLCAGAMGKSPLTVYGLDPASAQGDKKILDILTLMGADVRIKDSEITVSRNRLRGIEVDASQIPDLVPVIATVASVCEGKTVIYNAGRLRLKESDRIESVCRMLTDLGGKISPTDDGMIIEGVPELSGGTVDSFNDHRIAMSAAVASLVSLGKVTVTGMEAVNKSYPSFIADFNSLRV